jgi:predicted transglutaminase-like cysteine proteinase
MALGATAAAPRGFVEFCRRQPTDCGASQSEMASLSLAAQGDAGSPTVAAIKYDWSGVFAGHAGAPALAADALSQGVASPAQAAVRYDWSGVFAAKGGAPVLAANALSQGIDTPARAAVSYDGFPAFAGDRTSAAPAVQMAANQPVTLTPAVWALVNRTNETVNRGIIRRTDAETYGVAEVWTTPLETGAKYGDCEDYVLEKRRALLAAGLPASALSIAVVVTRGQTHAVLLVNTNEGEYVLDNLTPWVLPWSKTSYEWRERQVAGSASHWAMADAAGPQPNGLLLASLR